MNIVDVYKEICTCEAWRSIVITDTRKEFKDYDGLKYIYPAFAKINVHHNGEWCMVGYIGFDRLKLK
jgi:hypothetical protein